MLDLAGGGTMLALTVARVEDPDMFAPPVLVAGTDQAETVARALPEAGTLILEPEARNTAPAIALAALMGERDDLLLVLPSDHLVGDPLGFHDAVRRARPFAEDGCRHLRMKDDAARPAMANRAWAALGEGSSGGSFVEKPTRHGGRYAAGGRHEWTPHLESAAPISPSQSTRGHRRGRKRRMPRPGATATLLPTRRFAASQSCRDYSVRRRPQGGGGAGRERWSKSAVSPDRYAPRDRRQSLAGDVLDLDFKECRSLRRDALPPSGSRSVVIRREAG